MCDTIEKDNSELSLLRTGARIFAVWFSIYQHSDERIQSVVRDMISILNDDNADSLEKDMAIDTIVEALRDELSEGQPSALLNRRIT